RRQDMKSRRARVCARRPGARAGGPRRPHLSVDRHRHRAAVLRPGGFVGAEGFRALLAIADRRDADRVDTECGEIVLGGIGAALAKGEVIFTRTALVAMALDGDALLRIALQPLRLAAQ